MERQVRPEHESGLELRECPHCQWKSLFWNGTAGIYECLNRDCKATFARADIVQSDRFRGNHVASEATYRVDSLRRKTMLLSVCLVLAVIAAIGLGLGWSSSSKALMKVSDDLALQEQETQKYRELSDEYHAKSDEYQAKVEEDAIQIAKVQTDLDQTKSLYASTSAKLISTEAELQNTEISLRKSSNELALFKDTYGSVVASDIEPPFIGADIVNNSKAKNPTWRQLEGFILSDRTDQKPYIPGVYMCGDYAREVHNNAERVGIRCAWVAIDFVGQPVGHACNTFKTTDRGLIFIDCTGPLNLSPFNYDKIVNVKLGHDYVPESLFPQPGWEIEWEDIGLIADVQVYW